VDTVSSDYDSEEAEINTELIQECKKLYCMPVFMKPGKHQYMIKYKDTNEEGQKRALRRRKRNESSRQEKYDPEEIKQDLKPEIFFY
jgi:hypothetical protein